MTSFKEQDNYYCTYHKMYPQMPKILNCLTSNVCHPHRKTGMCIHLKLVKPLDDTVERQVDLNAKGRRILQEINTLKKRIGEQKKRKEKTKSNPLTKRQRNNKNYKINKRIRVLTEEKEDREKKLKELSEEIKRLENEK
jgi:hypothetical protein